MVLAISILTWALFRDTSQVVRLVVFFAVLLSAAAFVAALLRSGTMSPGLSKVSGAETEEENPPTRPGHTVCLLLESKLSAVSADAVVIEEDSYLVLGAPREATATSQAPGDALRESDDGFPKKLGSVLVRGTAPVKMLAIVHDLEQQPSWREDWISDALRRVMEEAQERSLESTSVPLLGARYGLDPRRSAELLGTVLMAHPGPGVRLTVTTQGDVSADVRGILAEWLVDSPAAGNG